MSILDALARRIAPFAPPTKLVRPDVTLRSFVWRSSGVHQFYVGALAVSVALVNFAPIDLQRRVVDVAIADKDVTALLVLGGLYLAAVLLHSGLKYALMVYQGWLGESAVKSARDEIAQAATERSARDHERSGQTANIIGDEIDGVGGFVGTTISESVVNATMMLAVASYMVYVQPVIALVSGIFLIPQILLALYMQGSLNALVERQIGLVRKLGDQAVESFGRHATRRSAAHRTIRKIFSNRIELYLLKFGLKTLLNIANAMGSLAVLIVGGYLVIQGQTTLGTVVAFISGFQRLADPMRDLLDFYRVYSQARVQYRMIVQWIDGDAAQAANLVGDQT